MCERCFCSQAPHIVADSEAPVKETSRDECSVDGFHMPWFKDSRGVPCRNQKTGVAKEPGNLTLTDSRIGGSSHAYFSQGPMSRSSSPAFCIWDARLRGRATSVS